VLTSVRGRAKVLLKALEAALLAVLLGEAVLKQRGLVAAGDCEAAELVEADWQEGRQAAHFVDGPLVAAGLDVFLVRVGLTCSPVGLK
jgi:hypothetical protein